MKLLIGSLVFLQTVSTTWAMPPKKCTSLLDGSEDEDFSSETLKRRSKESADQIAQVQKKAERARLAEEAKAKKLADAKERKEQEIQAKDILIDLKKEILEAAKKGKTQVSLRLNMYLLDMEDGTKAAKHFEGIYEYSSPVEMSVARKEPSNLSYKPNSNLALDALVQFCESNGLTLRFRGVSHYSDRLA